MVVHCLDRSASSEKRSRKSDGTSASTKRQTTDPTSGSFGNPMVPGFLRTAGEPIQSTNPTTDADEEKRTQENESFDLASISLQCAHRLFTRRLASALNISLAHPAVQAILTSDSIGLEIMEEDMKNLPAWKRVELVMRLVTVVSNAVHHLQPKDCQTPITRTSILLALFELEAPPEARASMKHSIAGIRELAFALEKMGNYVPPKGKSRKSDDVKKKKNFQDFYAKIKA